MKHILHFLALLLLSGCAISNPFFKPAQETASAAPPAPNYDQLLIEGVYDLVDNQSTGKLEALVEAQPDGHQAKAAEVLLSMHARPSSARPSTPLIVELEQVRLENRRLQEDLEKLRKLLIKSEKYAR